MSLKFLIVLIGFLGVGVVMARYQKTKLGDSIKPRIDHIVYKLLCICAVEDELICGSDGITYNGCKLRCVQQAGISVTEVHKGACKTFGYNPVFDTMFNSPDTIESAEAVTVQAEDTIQSIEEK